jgi:type II secretory pathway component PulM
MTTVSRLATRFPALYRWWAALARRDRRLLVAIATLGLALAAWWLVWQPLQRDAATMRSAAPGEAAALSEGRRAAEEIAGLARAAVAPPSGDPRGVLERILVQRGLRAAVTQLDWQDGRARVVFTSVGFDPLVAALEVLQRDGRLRIVEAVITARVEPGSVRAELTLAP